jgi:uncharacterized protein YkwD
MLTATLQAQVDRVGSAIVDTDRLPQSSTKAVASNSEASDLERATVKMVNKYRETHQLSPLEIDSDLTIIARQHSQEMLRTGKIGHYGSKDRLALISQKIRYRMAGENVGYNLNAKDPILDIVVGWISSPGHRRNMLRKYDVTGIGVASDASGRHYFTQLFVLKDPTGTEAPTTETLETDTLETDPPETKAPETSPK